MDMHYVVCLSNDDFEAALEPRKIYLALPDSDAEGEGLIRVIDESGEDYLYPVAMFEPIAVPARAARAFSMAG